jgi:hypothetical protein
MNRTLSFTAISLFLLAMPGLAQEVQPVPVAVPGAAEPAPAAVQDPYSIYQGGIQEVVIDEAGNIYKQRVYQGMVPGRKDVLPQAPSKGKIVVTRIGFEQMELFSRVFVATSVPVTPWIYDNFIDAETRPGAAYKIMVEIPGADIPNKNDRHPLLTSAFNTPVMQVDNQVSKDSVKIIITLKRKAGYLPVQGDGVVYIDIER